MNPMKKNKLSKNQRNSLGMGSQVYSQLLKKLDEHAGCNDDKKSPARIHTRLQYLDPFLQLRLETEDRSVREITVAARNISRGGLSILHSSFVYPGTRARMPLKGVNGRSTTVSGRVVRCEHRGGVVHEIGIRFDNDIIVQEYIRPDISESLRSHEKVNPEKLSGKALIIGNDPSITPLLREYLQLTSINYGFVESLPEALEKDPDNFDIIFICLEVGNSTGPEIAKALREANYDKPIILSGFCNDELVRNQIRLSTADLFVPAPLQENDLLCAFAEFLLTDWDQKTLKAIREYNCAHSTEALCGELNKLGITLDQKIRTNDAVQIFATCSKVRSVATLLGLSMLRDLSLRVGEDIATTGNPEPHSDDLNDIKAMCFDVANAA